MLEKETVSSPKPRKRGRWLVFVIGMLFGGALVSLMPRYAGPYLEALSPSTVVEGRVVDKKLQAERVMLKVTTRDGVLLASFTEKQDDIDLLVEPGQTIQLGADRYRPFLENPTLLTVRESISAPKGDDVASTKKAYQEAMEAKLRQWEAKLAELEASASEATGDAARGYEAELEKLRKKRAVVRDKLAELKRAGSSAWKDVKSGLDAAWAELDEALDAAAARFRDPEESPR